VNDAFYTYFAVRRPMKFSPALNRTQRRFGPLNSATP